MPDYPRMIASENLVEPAPRRVRGILDEARLFDTDRALYVWESARYPWYYVPLADVDRGLLVDEERVERDGRGSARVQGLRVGELTRAGAARLYGEEAIDGLSDTVRFEWGALDAWFEEDEQIFVHPRNPYTRVDALRSSRRVRVELDGALLTESAATVMVFETGLPTRYYFDRGAVDFGWLEASETVEQCPYKGRTGNYWSVRTRAGVHADLAWSYDFPTRQLLPIAGMVAFLNEKVDISVDGVALPRPETHFSPTHQED